MPIFVCLTSENNVHHFFPNTHKLFHFHLRLGNEKHLNKAVSDNSQY